MYGCIHMRQTPDLYLGGAMTPSVLYRTAGQQHAVRRAEVHHGFSVDVWLRRSQSATSAFSLTCRCYTHLSGSLVSPSLQMSEYGEESLLGDSCPCTQFSAHPADPEDHRLYAVESHGCRWGAAAQSA